MSFKEYGILVAVIAGLSFLTACGNGGSDSVAISADGGSDGAAIDSASTGSITLTWDAPATRSDGSSLNYASDLQSYKIYYGTSSQAYSQSISVANPGTSLVSYTVHLPQGTYCFAVTDIDQYGQESGFSPEITKTL